MNFSNKGSLLNGKLNLAIYALGHLVSKTEPTPLRQLAVDSGCSVPYLEQIFSLLLQANIVTSTRGAGGGYTLSDTTGTKTSIRSVAQAVDKEMFNKSSNRKLLQHLEEAMGNITLAEATASTK
ncbi:RrF2 family transcriptional regulator [Vibrio parahaemolyticus]|uniref:RrF2 family transcriptional regulator n=1 Tax=Vibrio parahaemolyticus TaxID=670 RepID=UPI00226B20C2|nr:Rrf2 family transcriptional regulator [Vibrio parahaemolyticus]MCX8817002.1 Rrf2 family transcriptional regulator [Vibrio parahaemolyticus]